MTRLLVLAGPTASGKSALALRIAVRTGAEIVSADARQVYRRLDVGTAKPSAAERALVRHHGLDLADPCEAFDVARWVAAADQAIGEAASRGSPVLVVGGTGLYLRVLLRGLCEAAPPHPDVRSALRELGRTRGPSEPRRWLERLDPRAASRIHPNDRVRTERALEVALTTGVPLSRLQRDHGFTPRRYDADVVVTALPADVLDARITARIDRMLAEGWIEEVRGLTAALPEDAPAWRTLGYRELRAHVRGEASLGATRVAVARATRRFAKRQRTWWRREARDVAVAALHPERDAERIIERAIRFLVAKREPAR